MESLFLEDHKELLKNIFPNTKDGIIGKLNCIGRICLILFLIFLLMNFKYSVHFLFISMACIILIFYYIKMDRRKKLDEQFINDVIPASKKDNIKNIKRNNLESFIRDSRLNKPDIEYFTRDSRLNGMKTNIEYFTPSRKVTNIERFTRDTRVTNTRENFTVESGKNINAQPVNLSKLMDNGLLITPENRAFCNDAVTIDPPTSFSVNFNQKLTGNTAHPVTRIAPVIAPPSHALEYWKDNNFIIHSAINSEGVQKDMYLSGYAESTCCGYLGDDTVFVPRNNNSSKDNTPSSIENYTGPIPTIKYSGPQSQEECSPPRDYVPNCQIKSPVPVQDLIYVPTLPVPKGNSTSSSIENYTPRNENNGRVSIYPRKSGEINQNCGYNPEQVFRSGLPSNLPSGNCEQDPRMKQYNENLFTQIVTPGVYTRSQVNEPINSNIGISFQQQFEPVTCKLDDKGLLYTQHDPRIVDPSIEEPDPKPDISPKYDNVFDPRFYGYGTSYRSYIDETTGQPRFMYDDVNAIRMPNYITRSKVDFLPYADTYGPMEAGNEYGNIHNPYMRSMVQDSWLRNSLQFRNDLTERQMRKINADAWQRRQSPFGPRML